MLLTGSWASASLEEGKYKHCNEVAGEMNSGKAHFLMDVKPPATQSCILEAPIVQKTLGLNQELRATEFMAGLTHLKFIREANDSLTWAQQTHMSTQLQSATSLVYKFYHSNHKLGCLTCLLRKYCHSCMISNSSYFITIDCSTFAGVIYYEGS